MARQSQPTKSTVHPRNKSPHGWWIASYVEVFEWKDAPLTNLNKRCTAWKNTLLIKAADRMEAYRKSSALAGRNRRWTKFANNRYGRWRYLGIVDLLPIYEKLGDGAEILWNEYANRPLKQIMAMTKRRQELDVFKDEDA